MRLRLVVIGLVVALIAQACSGIDDDLRSGQTDIDLVDALTAAGVTIVEDPAAAPPVDGPQLWTWQVDNMQRELEAGVGFLGSELDTLGGAPGGLPFSYLISGWMASGVSETSTTAARLMGDQHLDAAPVINYPTAVIVLFVADALQASAGDRPSAMPQIVEASFAGGGICSTLQGWVNHALDFVFNALKVDVQGSGFFSWLGVVWNAAVDLARDAVVGVIKTLTAPVIELIQDALVVVGVLGMIGSLLSRWFVEVEPSSPTLSLPVGDEPLRRESFTARVDTNIDFEWDDYVADCASVAGLDLPDPQSAAGSPVTWEVTGFPEFGRQIAADDVIDSSNEATLDWETTREESREGDSRTAYVWAHAWVVNDEYENLKSMIWSWINGKISGIPFEEQVKEGIALLLEPIFDDLVRLVEFRGQGATVVVHHVPDGSEGVTVTILNPDTWCEATTPEDPDGWDRILFEFPPDAPPPRSVPYRVRVDGLTEERATGLELKVSAETQQVFVDTAVDGKQIVETKIEPVPITTGQAIDDDSWIFEGTVPLGYELVEHQGVIVWAWVRFPPPGGGLSSDEEVFIAVDEFRLELTQPGRETCRSEDRGSTTRTYPASRFDPDVPLRITYEYSKGIGAPTSVIVSWNGDGFSKTVNGTTANGYLDAPSTFRVRHGPGYQDMWCELGGDQGCVPLGTWPSPGRNAFLPGHFGEIPSFTGSIPPIAIDHTRSIAGVEASCGIAVDDEFGEVELCVDEGTGAVLYVHTLTQCTDPDTSDTSCVEVTAIALEPPSASDWDLPRD